MDISFNHLFSRSGSCTPFSKNSSRLNQLKPSKSVFRNSQLKLSSIFAVLAIAAMPATAQESKAAKPTVVVGSKVDFSALSKATWLKDDAPKGFEPGKVYILECWATWCTPCIAAIPHVNGLHKKYYDKGLRVLGMSVWEGDQKKTKDFVINKGDGMAYPVAFTGDESAFSKDWLDAAGVESIPHAFVVKDGILLGSTQVSRLTTSLIETLLSGDAGAKKASDIMSSAQNNEDKTYALIIAIEGAARKGDAATMTKAFKELVALDPNHPDIPVLEVNILIARRDWPAATKALKAVPESEAKTSFISKSGRAILNKKHPYSEEFKKVLIELYADYVLVKSPLKGAGHFSNLSNIQWDMGDKESAISTAHRSIEAALKGAGNAEAGGVAYTRFAKTVKEGRMPERAEISKWLREAHKNSNNEK